MASEVISDILNGLVAAGTLSLAVATFYLGRGAARAAVDAVSPRVMVTWFRVRDEPGSMPAVTTEPGTVQPGQAWDLNQHGATRIAVRATGQLRNDSGVSALLRIETGDGTEVGPVTFRDPSPVGGPPANVPLARQGEWYVLPPGSPADFILYWWQPASAWADAWREREQEPEAPSPVTVSRLLVRGPSGEAEDRCELAFGGYVLVPHPRGDNWVIARADPDDRGLPGMAPPRIASIGLTRRSYAASRWRPAWPSGLAGQWRRAWPPPRIPAPAVIRRPGPAGPGGDPAAAPAARGHAR